MTTHGAAAEAGRLIKEVQASLRRRMDRALAPLGITTPQFAALLWLERSPGMSNASLAQHCFVTPQTMNLIVQKLAEEGFVKRGELPGKGKSLAIDLTPDGVRVLRKAQDHLADVQLNMFNVLSASQLDELISMLKLLRASEAFAG